MSIERIRAELSLALRDGAVYYFQHRDLTSPYPHYFVVANRNPLDDKIVIFGVFTSKIEKRKKWASLTNTPLETIVEISPSEYTELRKDSCIDCNDPKKMEIEQFIAKIHAGEVREHLVLPQHLTEKVYNAILLSPHVEEKIKKIIHKNLD